MSGTDVALLVVGAVGIAGGASCIVLTVRTLTTAARKGEQR